MADPSTDYAALLQDLRDCPVSPERNCSACNVRVKRVLDALASLKTERDKAREAWKTMDLMRLDERDRAVQAETALREAEEAFATVEAVAARAVQAETALRKYADPTNWGIEREEFRYPRCVWIGPGAAQRIPDAAKTAREALAVSSASEAETERGDREGQRASAALPEPLREDGSTPRSVSASEPNEELACSVCGKPSWWSMARLGDPCPDDDGHLVATSGISASGETEAGGSGE